MTEIHDIGNSKLVQYYGSDQYNIYINSKNYLNRINLIVIANFIWQDYVLLLLLLFLSL